MGRYGGDIAISAVIIITSFPNDMSNAFNRVNARQQPLISYNFGAGKDIRVKETLKYAIIGNYYCNYWF